jgi:hypothetical protein
MTYINPDSERWQRVKKYLYRRDNKGDLLVLPKEFLSWQESFYESFEKYREKPEQMSYSPFEEWSQRMIQGRDPGDENDSDS